MIMRTIAIALASTLVAGMALAQDAIRSHPTPDYSRPTLMRIFVTDEQISQPRFDFDVGQVTYRRHGLNLILGYLPFLAPLRRRDGAGTGCDQGTTDTRLLASDPDADLRD